jgi:outer membrane immunogenic protein
MHMKKFLLSTTALLGMTALAAAADLPARTMAPAPAPVMVAPVFTWTGFYIGGHIGYGFSDRNNFGFGDNLTVLNAAGGRFVVQQEAGGGNFFNNGRGGSTEGVLGGGQIGFNVQTGIFVFGVEADVTLTDFDNGRDGRFGNNDNFGRAAPGGFGGGPVVAGIGVANNAGANNVAFFNRGGFGGTESIDYFVTVRGKVGLAFDRMMIYGTGGVAFAETDGNSNNGGFGSGADVVAANPGFFVGPGAQAAAAGVRGDFNRRSDFDDVGYAVGGGVEYAFTNNISAKIEGLYVDFSGDRRRDNRNTVVGVSNTGAAIRAENFSGGRTNADFGLIRAGLNFRFNTF